MNKFQWSFLIGLAQVHNDVKRRVAREFPVSMYVGAPTPGYAKQGVERHGDHGLIWAIAGEAAQMVCRERGVQMSDDDLAAVLLCVLDRLRAARPNGWGT